MPFCMETKQAVVGEVRQDGVKRVRCVVRANRRCRPMSYFALDLVGGNKILTLTLNDPSGTSTCRPFSRIACDMLLSTSTKGDVVAGARQPARR